MYFATFILKNLWRRPIRTGLTVLGLAIAVGSMIALLGVSHNVEKSVESAFDVRRVDLVVMQKGKPMGLDSEFREYFVDKTREMPEVERVSEGVVGPVNVLRDSGTVDDNIVLVQGWKPDNFGYEDMTMIAGRRLEPGDSYKIILGRKLAGNLNKKVGDQIRFNNDPDQPYEVVGIFSSHVIFEEGGGIVPFRDGQRLHGKPGKVTGFSVRVKKSSPDSAAEVEAVKQKIEALRDPDDPTVRLSADPPDKYVEQVSQLQLIRAVTWLISAIALAVSVISLLNTMTMSVLERTQEIGILRAVGWPRGRVVRMILGEAAALAAAAALAGSAIAFCGMRTLTLMPKVNGFIEPDLAPSVVLRGFALTVLVGVIGGAYP
ncbi:MAG: ABC transporter permease, partial [Planctomycetes bacterium]|nr:ABC transporter permease [Planctomycetota bacterium]